MAGSNDDELERRPYYDFEDCRLPMFPWKPVESNPRKLFDEIKSIQLRPDDVVICAYSKSGTHWLWQLVDMMVKEHLNHTTRYKVSLMLDAVDPKDIADLPSPRVLNSHLLPDRLPDDLFTCGCKVIHIVRNPKDVAVSLYHHTKNLPYAKINIGWDSYLEMFLTGNVFYYTWFHYERAMEDIEAKNKGKILRLSYEDLKKDTSAEMEKIAKFIGLSCQENTIQEIVQKCSLENLRQHDSKEFEEFNKNTFGGKSVIYRKGIVGDWKSYFTVAQNEAFDKLYEETMKGSNMKFQYSL